MPDLSRHYGNPLSTGRLLVVATRYKLIKLFDALPAGQESGKATIWSQRQSTLPCSPDRA
jgi:hypothetical protein